MPYIKQERRKNLDELVDPLILLLNTMTEGGTKNTGDVVYVLYKTLKGIYGGGNFEIKSNALKAMDSTAREYYRRVMSIYEDRKIEENGDI